LVAKLVSNKETLTVKDKTFIPVEKHFPPGILPLFFINLPCWFKTSAFRPKGAPRNKRSDAALSGADWGRMQTPSQSLASSQRDVSLLLLVYV